jgi:ABC-type amino acid transport substrate-binding protein
VDPDIPSHLASIEQGRVDFGIAATAITSERFGRFDFSYPFYQADLGIIVDNDRAPNNLLPQILRKRVIVGIALFLVYLVVAGHIIWFLEREETGLFSTSYLDGIATGIWWTIVTMSAVGYADVYPKRRLGKVFASFVIISGAATFGIGIVILSSTLLALRLETPASLGPSDLIGRPVAVISGTQSVQLVEEHNMLPIEVRSIEEGVELFRDGKVDAVIHDSPLLKYYLKSNPDSTLGLSPQTFESFTYGITYPKGSPWREKLDMQLIKSLEDGSYRNIQARWFGTGK